MKIYIFSYKLLYVKSYLRPLDVPLLLCEVLLELPDELRTVPDELLEVLPELLYDGLCELLEEEELL